MTVDVNKLRAILSKTGEKLDTSIPLTATAFADKYLPFPQSPAWRAMRAAVHGEPCDGDELKTICGFKKPRAGGYQIAVAVTGRRGGKSANEACDGVFECVVRGPEHMKFLAPGQRGYVLVGSRSMRQAAETFRYARGIVEHHPELAAQVDEILEQQTGGEIRFKNGTSLAVFPATKANVRGYTFIAAILDEWAWIAGDEESANQDAEILNAVRYGMLAPAEAPMRHLVIISSPAGKSGVVYEMYKQHYCDADAPVLVAHGPTWVWNPSIDAATLEQERKRDPKAFTREVMAEFADAVSAWIDADAVRAAASLDGEPRGTGALLPDRTSKYFAAVDMAFKRDRSVLAIGHWQKRLIRSVREQEAEEVGGELASKQFFDSVPQKKKKYDVKFIVDGVWSWTPRPGAPLDAPTVVLEIADVCKAYGIARATADQFAFVPLEAEFKRRGVRLMELTATNFSKFENFTKLREAIYTKSISLPNDETALAELCQLQERVSGGSVQIGHAQRESAHDDFASAICWLYAAAGDPPRSEARVGSVSLEEAFSY